MMTMMIEVMEWPDSGMKVCDEQVVSKWPLEAVSEERQFSESMFDFVSGSIVHGMFRS